MTTHTAVNRFSTNWSTRLLRLTVIMAASACVWQPVGAMADAAAVASPSVAQQADNTEAMLNLDERKLIQEGLIWTGLYVGALDGNFSKEIRDAFSVLQQSDGMPATGVLDARLVMRLARLALNQRGTLGWEPVREPRTGMRLAYPSKFLTVFTSPNDNKMSIESKSREIFLDIERLVDFPPSEFDRYYTTLINDSKSTMTYHFKNDDRFIIAGSRGSLQFYYHYERRGNETRRLELGWFNQPDTMMKPMALLISKNFDPFEELPPHQQPDYSHIKKIVKDALDKSAGNVPQGEQDSVPVP